MTTVQDAATHGVPGDARAGTPSPLPATDATWPDDTLETLEFAAVLGVVAERAAGALGAERIRARRPTTDLAWIRRELARVGELALLERRGEKVVAEDVPDARRALARLRIEGSVLDGNELVAIRGVLVAARRVRTELVRVREQAPTAAELLVELPDKLLERRLEQSLDEDGNLLDTASPALAAARQAVQGARQRLLRRLDTVMRGLDAQALVPDAAVTVRNGRYVIPVRRDSRVRPAGIVHDESASGGALFLEPNEAVEQGNALREAQSAEEREALRVLQELSGLLRPARPAILDALEMCIAVDDLAARARYAAQHDAEVPAVTAAPGALRLVGARHPLLLAAGDTVVPFDLVLDATERTLLVSGPNTGGKTVLLKATALACAMAQSGIVPPLRAGSALVAFGDCFADIGDHQSIAANLSTFSAHVAMVRRILETATDATLVLLDEVGSGTDPSEGASLAAAVLTSLTTRGTVTLATTHLGALKTLASELPGVVNASLQFDEETLRPTYRFLKGVPGRSYGLAIARRLGVPTAIVDEAQDRVPAAERALDALLASVEARARELERLAADLEARAVETELLEARLAAQDAAQTAREQELRRREKESERTARAQVKQLLLDARKQVDAALAAARVAADDVQAREARRQLEEGLGAANAALEKLAADDERPAPAGAALAPGARIRTAAGVVGDILELRGDGRLVLSVNGMRMVVDPKGAQVLTKKQARATEADAAKARAEQAPPDATFEIDLRGMTGDEAAQEVLAALDAAVLAEQPYLRIIHGMGTGVVRDRVRRVLTSDRRVLKFEFAPRAQGGTGVTIAEFRP